MGLAAPPVKRSMTSNVNEYNDKILIIKCMKDVQVERAYSVRSQRECLNREKPRFQFCGRFSRDIDATVCIFRQEGIEAESKRHLSLKVYRKTRFAS